MDKIPVGSIWNKPKLFNFTAAMCILYLVPTILDHYRTRGVGLAARIGCCTQNLTNLIQSRQQCEAIIVVFFFEKMKWKRTWSAGIQSCGRGGVPEASRTSAESVLFSHQLHTPPSAHPPVATCSGAYLVLVRCWGSALCSWPREGQWLCCAARCAVRVEVSKKVMGQQELCTCMHRPGFICISSGQQWCCYMHSVSPKQKHTNWKGRCLPTASTATACLVTKAPRAHTVE